MLERTARAVEDQMIRGVFVAVLSSTVLLSVEPSFAQCRATLPPAAERVGHWQYRIVQGKRCWFGQTKAAARAVAIGKRMRIATKSEPVHASTSLKPLAKPPVIVPMPTLPVAPSDENDDIWPKPDASFAQRFEAARAGR
jgi:hypothetical protein